jgi:hypothetical protein
MDESSRLHLQEVLDTDPSCYVLITCGDPCEKGEMKVKLSYQGNADLAALLLQGAQQFIDEEEEMVISPHG